MSTLSLPLPNSLHENLRQLARKEGVSINQLITTVAAEKVSTLATAEYFEERARRSSREKFETVLAKVPDVEPPDYDRLPEDSRRARS